KRDEGAQSQEQQPQEPQPEEPQAQELQRQDTQAQESQLTPEEVEVPVHKYQELALFALELINRDRIANGLAPVVLDGNIASQNHAEESLTNDHSSHWSIDGLKPYMRYTLAGGVNYVGENVIGTGIESGDGSSNTRDPDELLEQAQERFMDSPTHRANILNKWHKKVSLGIAFDDENFHWVQHFEGAYINFSGFPSISGTILSMAGTVATGKIERIIVYYDPLPQILTPEQLNAPPYDSSYGLGERIGIVLPLPSPGSFYTNLAPTDVVAMTWDTQADGSFTIGADISPILGKGNGVYTIVVRVETGGEFIEISNYSIFVQ
ncbi:CAP domain-containing protein, partial [Chloroflexota bacterium]